MAKTTYRDILALAGRILLVLIFLLSGMSKLSGWSGTVGYLASKGIPAIPMFLSLAIIIEVVGAVSVVLGYQARWGALILFLYLIPVTLIFHNFWALNGQLREIQMINFMKNISIMGGLLLIASFGPGLVSFDAHAAKRHEIVI